jgi:hypothetical protein
MAKLSDEEQGEIRGAIFRVLKTNDGPGAYEDRFRAVIQVLVRHRVLD